MALPLVVLCTTLLLELFSRLVGASASNTSGVARGSGHTKSPVSASTPSVWESGLVASRESCTFYEHLSQMIDCSYVAHARQACQVFLDAEIEGWVGFRRASVIEWAREVRHCLQRELKAEVESLLGADEHNSFSPDMCTRVTDAGIASHAKCYVDPLEVMSSGDESAKIAVGFCELSRQPGGILSSLRVGTICVQHNPFGFSLLFDNVVDVLSTCVPTWLDVLGLGSDPPPPSPPLSGPKNTPVIRECVDERSSSGQLASLSLA